MENRMRSHGITSPSAAERYFDDSFIGQLSVLFAEALGGTRRRQVPRLVAKPPVSAKRPQSAAVAERRRSWLDRLDTWFWRRRQQEREAYLAESTDVFELERRIRALERQSVWPYY